MTRESTICVSAASASGLLIAASGSSAASVVAAAAGLAAYLWFAAVSVLRPIVFVAGFLLTLAVLPPFYFPQFAAPVFIPLFLIPIGLAVVIVRFQQMRLCTDSVAKGLAAFAFAVAFSIPFAWLLSGSEAGVASLARWLLLAQAPLAYCMIRGAWKMGAGSERRVLQLLFISAGASAAYGILDFIRPLSPPHPAADQFIWLSSAVVRRAQGVFYESSNFANFCSFFLVAASAGFLTRRPETAGIPRWLLLVLIVVLGVAVLVAFSRSVWASAAVGVAVATSLLRWRPPPGPLPERGRWLVRSAVVLSMLAVPLLLLWRLSPELWDYFLSARVGRLAGVFSDPNTATSGRFDTWRDLVEIMLSHPQYLVFGIGYKTLTTTRLFHQEMIADNGYLSLLVETGVFGLGGFVMMSGAILKTFLKLARSGAETPAFWAAVVFAIWCGELVLLLAADAYTYWRNMTIYAALMALTMNLSEHASQP